MASRALALVPRRQGITAVNDATGWTFDPETNGIDHFWSTDGTECLWCRAIRTPADVHKWDTAGRPAEKCAGQ